MSLKLVSFHPSDNPNERKKFVALPWTIYQGDRTWVPPLRLQVLDDLDTKKNPYYRHADINLWNAYLDGKHVGRIAAIIDERHIEVHQENVGFFGFFECINNQQVADALFAAAGNWLKERGMEAVRGPANPSMNHTCGLQVDAFDLPPYIMMPQNHSYYMDLFEKAGLKKEKDLLAYPLVRAKGMPERLARIAKLVQRRNKIVFRSINLKDFKNEVARIKEIYNDAWEHNWGFVPWDDAEFEHMAKSMKDIIWPDYCIIGEQNGEPIGFAIALPDINQVLKSIPSGKLLPFGIFKLLMGVRPNSGKINRVRIVTLGVKKAYRNSGLASLVYHEFYDRAKRFGLEMGEASWVLEDNLQMRSLQEDVAAHYKTYRMYQKSI